MSDSAPTCRLCSLPLERVFVDLGMSPLSNAYLKPHQLQEMEPFYPLRVFVCEACLLVQLPESQKAAHIFGEEYLYFSSYSESWLRHCQAYAAMAIDRFHLSPSSLVVELASNDGYLLQYFKARQIPVLGVEPSANVARVAIEERGVPTLVRFFGEKTARELLAQGPAADLIVGNNVLAHVPDLHDFLAGIRLLLRPAGVVTLEFPHLLRLVGENQFDTIYHEHFSYFSFLTARRALERHGLVVFDVDELPTHGGSLRLYAGQAGPDAPTPGARVLDLERREQEAGFHDLSGHLGYRTRVEACKRDLLTFLIDARKAGKRVLGYGAPAKGNTLLNYCGVREDLLELTVDRSPHKQGRYLPGTHIPILAPEALTRSPPDYVLILPWNLRAEIVEQLAQLRAAGTRFVVPIPRLEILGVKISPAPLAGAYILDAEVRSDERGSFARTFDGDELAALGMNPHVAQMNISSNLRQGTLRGLHFQAAPHGETKVVRCTRGRIFDVIVDIRPESPTCGRWFGIELAAESRRALYVPLGFAHGFQTLCDDAEVFYLMGARYVAEAGRGFRHDDPAFGIKWPLPVSVISERDLSYPAFAASPEPP